MSVPDFSGFIDEVGVENVKSVGIDKLWYNGPYILTEFIQGNTKTLTKNESYWDKDCNFSIQLQLNWSKT